METRIITQVKVYKLILNPMRGRMEEGRIVAMSYDLDTLIKWYKEQFAEAAWTDDGWHKAFKKDSPLEWFNPEDIFGEGLNEWGKGIASEWAEQKNIEDFSSRVGIPIIHPVIHG